MPLRGCFPSHLLSPSLILHESRKLKSWAGAVQRIPWLRFADQSRLVLSLAGLAPFPVCCVACVCFNRGVTMSMAILVTMAISISRRK